MLLIFDWDGTLADSRDHIVLALQQTSESMGMVSKSDQQCAKMIGLGLRKVALGLYPELSEPDVDQFCNIYSKRFISLGQSQFPIKLFEGVTDTLLKLKSDGHRLAVATGKSRAGLDRVLNNLNMTSFFDITRTADETASKPHPKMLQEILIEAEEHVANAAMIGDTSYDLEMAQKINMRRIAVSYGVHDSQTLQQFNPSVVLNRIEEILAWVDIS